MVFAFVCVQQRRLRAVHHRMSFECLCVCPDIDFRCPKCPAGHEVAIRECDSSRTRVGQRYVTLGCNAKRWRDCFARSLSCDELRTLAFRLSSTFRIHRDTLRHCLVEQLTSIRVNVEYLEIVRLLTVRSMHYAIATAR